MIDTNYIEEIKQLDIRESKEKLAKYAEQFDIQLKKTKSFDNMVSDLSDKLTELANEPLPEDQGGMSISELMDAEQDNLLEEKLEAEKPKEDLVEEVVKQPKEPEIVDQIEGIEENTAQEVQYELPKEFSPVFSLIGPTPGFYTLQWWIYAWILENENWKEIPESFPRGQANIDVIKSLIYYIKRDGSVVVRETRNSRFVTLT